MRKRFLEAVEENPIIAAVKDEKGLEESCRMEEINIIFVLFGDVCSIRGIVEQIHTAGKLAMVHIDLISGLSAREAAIDYLKENACADGIITTRTGMAQYAESVGLYTVLRFFVIDSMSLKSIENLDTQKGSRPDFIEILPGIMPKVIQRIRKKSRIPIIAGGLIYDREDVMGALNAGASAVSSTNPAVWRM